MYPVQQICNGEVRRISFFLSCIFCRGLRKLAMRNLGFGIKEMYRGFNIAAQVKLLQRYVPSLKVSDVTRYSIPTYSM